MVSACHISDGAWAIPNGSAASVETPVEARATTSGGGAAEVPAREERPDRVAERHRDDGQRGEQRFPSGCGTNEQRDADEADPEAGRDAARRRAPPGRTRTQGAR